MGRLCLRIPHACVPWWLPSHTTFLSKQFFCVPSFAFLRSNVPNFASPSWFSILNRKLITYTVYTCLAPHPIVLHSTFPCYFTKFAFHVPSLLYKICIPILQKRRNAGTGTCWCRIPTAIMSGFSPISPLRRLADERASLQSTNMLYIHY